MSVLTHNGSVVTSSAGVLTSLITIESLRPRVWLAARKESYTNGQVMPTLTDWSGNGAEGTQATVGFRASFATNQINGLPAFNFSRANSHRYICTNLTSPKNCNGVTSFVVYRKKTSTVGVGVRQAIFGYSLTTGATRRACLFIDFDTDLYLLSTRVTSGASQGLRKSQNNTTPHVVCSQINYTTGLNAIWEDGEFRLRNSIPVDPAPLCENTNLTHINYGSDVTSGTANSFIDAYWAEYIMFDRVLAPEEIGAVNRILKTLYAI